MPHHLRSTRRQVLADQLPAYLRAWIRVRDAAEARGARAWLFRGDRAAGTFLEFVEWSAEAGDPLADPAVMAAVEALAPFGDGVTEHWAEALLPGTQP